MLRVVELLAAFVTVGALVGCHGVILAPRPSEPVVVARPGPPSHAPAHGYRRKHESGADLRFDQRLGVYIVVGHANVYFHDGWFLRIRSGAWQVSASPAGPWKPKNAESLPPGLRAKYHAKKPTVRGHGAAKGAW